MAIIDQDEDFGKDWDWYACDPAGNIGHFTTAGQRKLPSSVKENRDAALQLADYFFNKVPKSFQYKVREEAAPDAGGWPDEKTRNRYLRDFVTMASAGLFSYDTMLYSADTKYFLVAYPERPLHVDELPLDIKGLILRTKSPYLFSKAPYISEQDTQNW